MNNLEQITKLVSDFGLKPSDVVKYWRDKGLLSEQTNVPSASPKNKNASLDLRQRVKTIIADKIGSKIEEITEESNLQKDLSLDSLDEVELVMQLEKEFKIAIPDEETFNVKTVADIIQVVANHM